MLGVFGALRECGWAAYIDLLLGLLGLATGAVGLLLAALKSRGAALVLGMIAIVLGICAVSVGMLGRQMGISRLHEILDDPSLSLDPSQRQKIEEVGTMEANQCVKVGMFTGAFPFVLGAAAVALGLLVRKNPPFPQANNSYSP